MKNKVLIISFEKFRKTTKYSDGSGFVNLNMYNSGFTLLHVIELNENERSRDIVEQAIQAGKIEQGTIVWRRTTGRFFGNKLLEIYYNSETLF